MVYYRLSAEAIQKKRELPPRSRKPPGKLQFTYIFVQTDKFCEDDEGILKKLNVEKQMSSY